MRLVVVRSLEAACIRDVHLIGACGWAVGSLVHRTLDGGLTWTQQPWCDDIDVATCVAAIDADACWIAGDDQVDWTGRFAGWSDAAERWELVTLAPSNCGISMQAIARCGASAALMVGCLGSKQGLVWRSLDDGLTWQALPCPDGMLPRAVAFGDDGIAWMLAHTTGQDLSKVTHFVSRGDEATNEPWLIGGRDSVLFRTEDTGDTWTPHFLAARQLYDLALLDRSRPVLCGSDASVVVWRGEDLEPVSKSLELADAEQALNSVAVFGDTIVAGGDGPELAVSLDGGKSWSAEPIGDPPDGGVARLTLSTPQSGLALVGDGTLLHFLIEP